MRDWEQELWRDYLGRYGHTADVTSANDLHITPDTRLNMALRIVPRYVRPGAREAWDALVNDPAFLGSTVMGITAYFALWLTPEPFFTKTAAVLTTIGLVAVAGFTAVEIIELARAWMRLRDDVSKARTLDAIERVAERFGTSLGGSSLRLLLALTTAIAGKVLPASPRPVAPGPVTAGAGAGTAVLGAAGHAVKLVKGGVVVLVAPLAMAKPRGAGIDTGASRKASAAKTGGEKATAAREFPLDYVTKNTINRSAKYGSEREARALARTKLGPNPVQVEPRKLRSRDGRWQYRGKPEDLQGHGPLDGPHIHLERLDPKTGEVLENWHLRW